MSIHELQKSPRVHRRIHCADGVTGQDEALEGVFEALVKGVGREDVNDAEVVDFGSGTVISKGGLIAAIIVCERRP